MTQKINRQKHNYQDLDAAIRFTFKDDLLTAVKKQGYDYVSQCVFEQYYRHGQSMSKIAGCLQVTASSISHWMRRWGFIRREKGGNVKNLSLKDEKVIQKIMERKGLFTIAGTAKACGCSPTVVSRFWKKKNMKVIILNGPAGSGKGTFVGIVKDQFNVLIYKYSSIDWVKNIAMREFGWNGIKDTAGRNLLAALKQAAIKYGDIPFKKVTSHMSRAMLCQEDIFITDIREPEEIKKIKNYCQKNNILCLAVRIINDKAEKAALSKGLSKTGDNSYCDYPYDLYIPNNRTPEEFAVQINKKIKGVIE